MHVLFGGSGLVGSGIRRAFYNHGTPILHPNREELDLFDFLSVKDYLAANQIHSVIMAAGQVGGISFNQKNQLDQYTRNHLMNFNVLRAAEELKIRKMLLVSSSCIYPRDATKPLKENDLLSGPPEFTNLGYSVAKRAAVEHLQLCNLKNRSGWIACVPTNVIGWHRKFEGDTHVVPSLIRRISEAKKVGLNVVQIWGDGEPIREFIDNRDLGDAIHFLSQLENIPELINIGSGERVQIKELISQIADILEYRGTFLFDSSRESGHPNKSLDSTRIQSLGWSPQTSLIRSLKDIVTAYEDREKVLRG